jgi:uncharacterized protein (DUF4213/DUF364 family)
MLERNDYVKANKKLVEKVNKAAEMLLRKMEELHLEELHLSYSVLIIDLETGGLRWRDGGNLTLPEVSSIYNAYNADSAYATAQEFLDFAYSWQEIKEVISNLETEKTKEIEKTLENEMSF